MNESIAFIGFGEAAQTFSSAPKWRAQACGFDLQLTIAGAKAEKLAEFERCCVRACASLSESLADAQTCLSLVTADQSVAAATAAAPLLQTNTLFLDMNSVSPQAKRAAQQVVAAAGGRYVDVAIMAPVQPAALDVPLLVSGPYAQDAVLALNALGFAKARTVGPDVGQASTIKLVRSVVVKGAEALAAECLLAAATAGVTDEVLGSFDPDARDRMAYQLDRMLQHGGRRAAEMEHAAETLRGLGVEPTMTAGTITRQRAMGLVGDALAAKSMSKENLVEEDLPEDLDARLQALIDMGVGQES